MGFYCRFERRLLHKKKKEKISTKAVKESGIKVVPKNTLLYSFKLSIGKVAITENEIYTNEAIVALPIKDNSRILLSYLYWAIQVIDLTGIGDTAVMGLTLNKEKLKNLEIPLPPLPIQKRIAEILDTADALRRKDEALLKKYDELAQAIFIDMFGDPVKNEKGWEVKKFSEVSNKITDREHATPIRQSDGIHLLSARNIQNGYISLKNGVDYISESEYNRISKRCNPEFGDILLSCSGSVGRCTVYRSSDKISLVRSVALIKPKHEKINSTYFEFSIRSEFLQNQILQNSSKSSQANLFTGKIKELNILVPHIELQKKFESIIELLTKQVSIKKIKNSENLFNSPLQKAFNGELIV